MVGLPGYPSTILLHGSSEEGVRSPRLVTAIFKPAAKFPVVGIALISAVAVGVVAQVEQVRRVFESKTSEGGLLRYEAGVQRFVVVGFLHTGFMSLILVPRYSQWAEGLHGCGLRKASALAPRLSVTTMLNRCSGGT
jgi:hypothetical protein